MILSCSTKKMAIGNNEISIIKELKDKKRTLDEPDLSTLTFSLIDKQNKTPRNVLSLIFINGIQFKADANEGYLIKVLTGKFDIQIISPGYYPQKLKLETEKEYDYKITLLWDENPGSLR
jgi:hypothetical protein